MNLGYIYSLDNVAYRRQYFKYGFTMNPHERLDGYKAASPYPFTFQKIYKILCVPTDYKDCNLHDNVIKTTLGCKDHGYNMRLFYQGGSTEFATGNCDEIKTIMENAGYVLEEIALHNIYKSSRESKQSVHKRSMKERMGIVDDPDFVIKEGDNEYCEVSPLEEILHNQEGNEFQLEGIHDKKFNLRPYQQETIDYASEMLMRYNRLYIELATGGGKSYIVFNILRNIDAEIIVIFSPRQIINAQNSNEKYTKIIGDDCNVFNMSSNSENFDTFHNRKGKKLIFCCIQSYKKVCNFILEHELKNVVVWFDEAHWGVDDWVFAKDNNPKHFLLEDTSFIKKRIFTSASPSRDFILTNKRYFGELYRPIKISELIALNWLCTIKPYVFSEEKVNADILYYMLSHFKENNKKHGLSFHHSQASAFQLFYEHLLRFREGKTNVKPFLLVSDFNIPDKVASIIGNDIISIDSFEQTPFSIGYVVAKYSMGYDFNKIDLICFSDYKMSPKDIIQSIGRGTRPDCLGTGGKNKNKVLDVLLPVFIKNDSLEKYDRIKEVLLYLVHEVEIPFNQVTFIKGKRFSKNGETEVGEHNGIDEVKSAVLELIQDTLSRGMKLKDFVRLLKDNGIHDLQSYYKFREERPELNLPEYLFTVFQDFKWIDTYSHCPFYDKERCIEAINELLESLILNEDTAFEELYDEEEKIDYLHKINPNIPNQPYWRFYGGNKKTFRF
jgi:hypothetical protein